MKRILSISGGGMRGVIPGRFLLEIEAVTGKPVQESFDLIAGTSTGAILAALCARPNPTVAKRMLEFYFDRGPRIFKKGWFNLGLTGPKFRTEDLQRELRACIGESHCGEIRSKLLIPTLEGNKIEATFIKSWDEYWQDFPLWAAAAASSSAQTYFPAYSCERRGARNRYLDGGNHSNNPADVALYEAWRLWPGEELMIVHLGTGKQRDPKPLPDGGIMQWAPLAFGTTTEGQDDRANYACTYAPGVKYFRFDVSLDRFPPMEDASRETLNGLVNLTTLSIGLEAARWHELKEALR